jgi:hypothetical protein
VERWDEGWREAKFRKRLNCIRVRSHDVLKAEPN